MRTNTFIKALAFAMLLATACNKNEIANDENTDKKGFALPVTVNVTREGDDATKATYNETTRKLEFSAGDKLFVSGSAGGYDYQFAGTLDYVSGGTFSGTIYIDNEWTGTFEELLEAVEDYEEVTATLLPAGYEDYGFLTIKNNDPEEKYYDSVDFNFTYTLATSKAAGVEQFSYEESTEYSSGFALMPKSTILNFTITGLAANTNVDVALTGNTSAYNITRTVTTDASGNATFAAGIYNGASLNLFSLTVGGNAITLPTKDAEVGKIYNITRSATATTLSELKTVINSGTDCSSYIGWEVNSAGAIAASSVSGTKIGYVAYVSTSDVDAGVSGSRILVLANADAGTSILWGSQGTSRNLTADDLNGYSKTNTLQGYGSEAHPAACAAWNYSAAIPSGGATPAHWFMPTKKQWENMRDVYSGGNLVKRNAMVSAYGIDGNYWTSTEYSNDNAYRFATNGGLQNYSKEGTIVINVRAVFAY